MTALQEAQDLYRQAREHKLAADHHRKAARQTMEEVRAICERFGFTFEVVRGGVDESHGPENHSGDIG